MSLRKSLLLSILALAVSPASASAVAPDVETLSIQPLDASSAEVLGRINPRASVTQYRVEYGPAASTWCQSSGATGSSASQTAWETLSQANNAYHVVSLELSGLTTGTSYCARVAAQNVWGPGHGSIVGFTAGAPGVQALSGQSTGATTALVGGSVNPTGSATQYWARYAPASSQWCQTSGDSGSPLDVTSPQTLAQTDFLGHGVSVALSGLDPKTDYCAQLVASNATGAGSSDVVTFATDVAPVQICSATWNGGAGNWTDPNWTFQAPATDANDDGYPDADERVCIPSGVVSLPGAEAVAGLRVTGTGRLDIAGGLSLDDPATEAANDGGATVTSGGAIQLTSTAAAGSYLVGGTLTNGGAVRTLVGWGGARLLSFAAIANGGGATLESNTATSIGAFSLTNSGTITVNGGIAANQHTTLSTGGHELNQNAGSIGGVGTFLLQNGTYHHNGGDTGSTVLSTTNESLDLDGSGNATVNAASGTSYLGGDVSSGKTVNVLGGVFGQPATLSLAGNRANAGTIVLTNAAAGDDGAAALDVGANTLTNTGTIRSRGVAPGAGSRAVLGTGTLANAAAGSVALDHATTVESHLASAGTVDVAAGVTATMSDFDFVQTAGTTTLAGRLDLTAGRLDLQGGTLAGDGQVGGALQNGGGTVSPGGSAPAELSVSGNYTQGAQGTLRIDVDGTDPGTGHDRLAVGGTATLGGNLLVDSAAFTPDLASQLTFVTSAGSLGGTFATESGMSAGGERGYDVAYVAGAPGSARLVAVRQLRLDVARAGTGAGTVTAPGIACGTDCTELYDADTVVTLTASPSPGSRFAGWTGAGTESCGAPVCQVTMSQARSVTAAFAQTRALIVTKTGSGSGRVSGAGIDCGTDCFESHDQGASVTLTATPGDGSRFSGWTGDCSGTGTCAVTMTQSRSVTATFTKIDDDGDGVSPPADCDDGNAARRPGATDTPGNGVDEDCSGADAQGPPPPATGDPQPAGPQPAGPQPTDPQPAGPQPAGPQPTDPSTPFGATDSNDTLDATGVGETICGMLGDDVINALGGDDTVFGDLCGVKAKLAATAAAGGDDTVSGGTGNDTIYGAAGNDRLAGDDGNDRLFGGAGSDRLSGGRGKDSLDGGAGNDKLSGGPDANSYRGGAGDDTVNARNGKVETIDCGAGRRDSAAVDRRDRVKGCEKVKRARK
ncbi:MAG TPA: MopE-related protein [Thermoleophilaceae bacterium]